MKNVLTSPKIYMLACLLIIVITASAWQLKTKKQPRDTTAGTVTNSDTAHPRKHDISEDEYGLDSLDNNLEHLGENLKNIDFNFKGLDTCIEKSVREALANINFAEINRNTKEALDKIDWQQLKTTIDNSIREAQTQLKNIDWDKIRDEVKNATDKINSKEFKEQFNNNNIQKIIDDAMDKATEGLENAGNATKLWKDFINQLESDGLIDKKKGYKIEWNDNEELIINGKKQPKEINDKYHKYFKEGGFTLKHDGDETESL